MQNDKLNLVKILNLQKSHLGSGKALGQHVWLHRSAVEAIEHPFKSVILSLMDDRYCVVRLDKKSSNIQLSLCPGFDLEREPLILGHKTYLLKNNSSALLKSQIYQTDNSLIFHHKHLFVTPNYSGFDIQTSIQWSLAWKRKLGSCRKTSSRIGRINGWNESLRLNEIS